jgi:hypothetical protein
MPEPRSLKVTALGNLAGAGTDLKQTMQIGQAAVDSTYSHQGVGSVTKHRPKGR